MCSSRTLEPCDQCKAGKCVHTSMAAKILQPILQLVLPVPKNCSSFHAFVMFDLRMQLGKHVPASVCCARTAPRPKIEVSVSKINFVEIWKN